MDMGIDVMLDEHRSLLRPGPRPVLEPEPNKADLGIPKDGIALEPDLGSV